MATVRWHIDALSGSTLTLRLYPQASGSIANGAGGDAMTEAGDGLFTATVAETLTGWHKASADKSGSPVWEGWVDMSAASPVVVETIAASSAPASTVVGRYDDAGANYPTVTCIVGETGVAKSVTVTDTAGDPVDLTDWGDKVLVIERPQNRTDVQVITNASITISGASSNVFTFQPNSTVLADKADFLWSLREVSTGDVIVQGRITVSYSPLDDTP